MTSWDPFATTEAAATPPRVAQLKLSPVTRSAASSPRGLESALMTPRGNTLRTVKNLHRRRVIDDRDVAVLKDAVVDGNDISGLLDLLQECTPNDRFKVDSIIMKVPRPRTIVAKNSFRALRSSPGKSPSGGARGMKATPSFGDLFKSPGSPRVAHSRVAALRAGAAGGIAKKGSFSDLVGGGGGGGGSGGGGLAGSFSDLATAADPFAAASAPAPAPADDPFALGPGPASGAEAGAGGDEEEVVSVTDDDWFNFANAAPAPAPAPAPAEPPAPPTAGAGAGAGSADAPTPPAPTPPGGRAHTRIDTRRSGDAPNPDSPSTPRQVKSGADAGEARGLLWVRESHFMLKQWKSRFVVLARGRLHVYESVPAMRMGQEPTSVIQLTPDTELMPLKTGEHSGKRLHYREVARTVPKHQRLFKFGCETMPGVSKWAKAIRVALQNVATKSAQRAADAATMAAVLHPTQAGLKESSTTKQGTIFSRRASLEGESKETVVTVETLNHERFTIVAPPQHTLHDVCLELKRQVKLEYDGDFSVFLREHNEFSCLPEDMKASQADAAALSDSRALVYRRRICMDCNQPIDEEAATATEINQAAHKLLFGEAVHPVVSGHYLVSNDDAHRLAALHLLSEVGQYDEAGDQMAHLRTNLPHYVSALCCLDRDTSEVVAAIHNVYVTLKMSALEAQRVYLSFCQKLPEYGARFFVGTMLRNVSSRGEGTGNPARTPPSWLHDTRRESGMDVLLGINPAGVHVRPAPPVHDQRYKPLRGVDVLSPWYLHPTRHIEVWGTKNRRPVLTYRVREARVMDVQVHSPSYKEMASVIHMYVYQLLADREGRKAPPKRLPRTTLDNVRAEAAAKEAEEPLAPNWVEIKDPLTGETCWWNQVTKVTVWTRPTLVVEEPTPGGGFRARKDGAF